jgi:hypothetical protein
MCNLILFWCFFFLLSFILWYVGMFLRSFLPFTYNIWFHLIFRWRWQPRCDSSIITNHSRRLQSKTKFRYGILYNKT